MKEIKDSHGNVLGRYSQNSTEKKMYTFHGVFVGTYKINEDVTYDNHGCRIGTGDQTVGLLDS